MIYDDSLCSIVLTLDELCKYANLCGSLDKSHRIQFNKTNISSEIYNKLIKKDSSYCLHDISLSLTHKNRDLYYTVNDTVDTVIIKGNEIRVDMACQVSRHDLYAPPKQILLSLLRCKSLFVATKYDKKNISARLYLVYSNTDGETETKKFDYYFSIYELTEYFCSLIDKIAFRAELLYEKEVNELPSASSCVFPYDHLRNGQEMMIRECYSAIKNKKILFVQAPTGTGKTVASLYPAVRALGNKLVNKIFYVTSKASTRREAFKGVAKLFESGTKIRCIVIGAKEQVCINPLCAMDRESDHCNSKECSCAAGYYDKKENAIRELINSGHGYTISQVSKIAKKYQVCPYELSLDLSELCDIIICDYNYIFDPSVYFRRYFSDECMSNADNKYVFLVDEAHNLVDRARDMYSASLKSTSFYNVYIQIPSANKELKKTFEDILFVFSTQRGLCSDNISTDSKGVEKGFYISNTEISGFTKALEIFKKKCDKWLNENKEHELFYPINNLILGVRKYICISEYFDKRFYNYLYVDGQTVGIHIFCLDPSYILEKIENKAVSTIMFSATMTPLDYFARLLGGANRSETLSLPSPFDPSKLCVAVAGYVSTRFEDRKKSISKYVSVIAATVSRRAGNYIVYFPSYECMEEVYNLFVKKYPDVLTEIQKRGMTFSQKEDFISFFKDDQSVLRIGFCVLGGSFSEGVDLPGSRLIGTVIFGVGLPGLSNERNIMREYYDNRSEPGYDFAYAFPGMNNVLQAAGRVIRREDDRGVVVLADDRYCDIKYLSLFPKHWKNVMKAGNASELAEIIQNFWHNP